MLAGMEMLLILCVFMVAGAVKGLAGLGLPTVALALLGLRLPPAEAAALLVAPALLTNLWQAGAGPALPGLLRRLWPLLLGQAAGIALGGLISLEPALLRLLLAEALMLYAMIGLLEWSPRLPAGMEPWLSPLVGLATGVLTAVTGLFVLPLLPYLQALRLDRHQLVQALGLCFSVSALALAVLLRHQGTLALAQLGLSLLATVPAVAGMAMGWWLRHRLSPLVFRRLLYGMLFALGVEMLLR